MSTTTENTRPLKKARSPRLVPEHMQLTEHELSLVARLIRVVRTKRGLLGLFIEHLLELDAGLTGDVTVKDIETSVKELANFEGWSTWLPKFVARWPSATSYNPLIYGQPPAYVGRFNDEFYELVRVWRLEHPEPIKRQLAPAGHLGQEESGD